MKFLSAILISMFSLVMLSVPLVETSVYAACNPADSTCIDVSSLPNQNPNTSNIVATILNIFFVIIGSISVLMVTIAGFKFITSSGKPEEVAKAKDTILYAGVGIIVCVMAVTIVSFIAGTF